jgi:hypothetical protein
LRRYLLYALALMPTAFAFALLQLSEPLPRHWLDPAAPYYWENVVRAFVLLLGGLTLGMISFTMLMSIRAEATVTGGHPRKKLYNHVTFIALGHGILMVTLLFYVRGRVDLPLSPATPFALVGLVCTIVALALMLSYQNSRLKRFHSAKQVLGTLELGGDRRLCVRVKGSLEPMSLERWLASYDTGELVRLTVEKVEELGGNYKPEELG